MGPEWGRADSEGVADGLVDLGGVVGWLVVEQQGQRLLAGLGHRVTKRRNDGVGVLDQGDVGTHEGAGVGVHIEFEVEDVQLGALRADGRHRQQRAVTTTHWAWGK